MGWQRPQCGSSKVAFRSQGDALRALDRIARTNAQAVVQVERQPQRAYHCNCGAWHLTSLARGVYADV